MKWPDAFSFTCSQNIQQSSYNFLSVTLYLTLLCKRSIQNGQLIDYDIAKKVKDKIVIVEFWETWCIPCIKEMSHLKKLKDKYPNELQIICISSDNFKKTSDFVKKNLYPFDFIFDGQKKVAGIFPHTMIPFSVVIDKKGTIQAKTLPSYVDDIQIDQMLSGNAIDLPQVKNFNPSDLEHKRTVPSLVSFELSNHELGDNDYSKFSKLKNSKRIVTGYSASAYIDTLETVSEYIASGKNILQLYQFAFGNIAASQFTYSADLNYIGSIAPNHQYKLNYKISDLFGNFNSVLINQLNSAFGLETDKMVVDTTVLVLKKVRINGSSIKLANLQAPKSMNTRISNYEFFEVSGNKIDSHELANSISNKTHQLVQFDSKENLSYELKVIMNKPTSDLDEWINYFREEGLDIQKERKTIEFVRIIKRHQRSTEVN